MSNRPPPGTLSGNVQAWDAVAEGYAEHAAKHVQAYVSRALEILPLSDSDCVLDLASGPGSFALAAAPLVKTIDAVDISPGMIEQLEALAAKAGISNVRGLVMNAESLDLPDQTYDAVFCFFGFMFFPDRAKAFSEIYRVLRPHGRALIATWATIDKRPLMRIGFEAMAQAIPDLPKPLKGDLQTCSECEDEMRGAGFSNVQSHPFGASMFVPSAEDFARFSEASNAGLAVLRQKMGAELWQDASVRFRAALAERIPEGGIELEAEALLTVGDKA